MQPFGRCWSIHGGLPQAAYHHSKQLIININGLYVVLEKVIGNTYPLQGNIVMQYNQYVYIYICMIYSFLYFQVRVCAYLVYKWCSQRGDYISYLPPFTRAKDIHRCRLTLGFAKCPFVWKPWPLSISEVLVSMRGRMTNQWIDSLFKQINRNLHKVPRSIHDENPMPISVFQPWYPSWPFVKTLWVNTPSRPQAALLAFGVSDMADFTHSINMVFWQNSKVPCDEQWPLSTIDAWQTWCGNCRMEEGCFPSKAPGKTRGATHWARWVKATYNTFPWKLRTRMWKHLAKWWVSALPHFYNVKLKDTAKVLRTR